jgi:hypothetical protein
VKQSLVFMMVEKQQEFAENGISSQLDSILVGDETGSSTAKAEAERSSRYKHIGC